MSLSQNDFRRLLRKGLGNLSSTDLDDDECDELLNMSLWEIEDQFEFEMKEDEVTTQLIEDQYQYNLGTITRLDAIRSVSYIDERGQSRPMQRMTRQSYDSLYNDGTDIDPAGDPQFYMREGNILIIWPPPKTELANQSLVVAIKEGIANIGTAGIDLPRAWDQIVLLGAIAIHHFLNQDYDLHAKAENIKISKIRAMVPTESKEEEDSRYAGLQVIYDRPSDDDLGWEPTEGW